MFSLKGKVAVVTGATGELGSCMCAAMAQQGCDLVLASRSMEKARQLGEKLETAYGVETLSVVWDAQDAQSIRAMAEESARWKGRVDVLVNNAGGNRTTSAAHFLDRSDDDIRYVTSVNLLSPMFCCREFGKIMKRQKSGCIINVASIAGIVGRDRRIYHEANVNEQLIDYAAAKGGVISMSRDLAALMAPFGVRVNAISPGGFSHGTTEAFRGLYGDKTPVGRMGSSLRDIGGAVVFLASDEAQYVVGHNLVVDGGFTIWR